MIRTSVTNNFPSQVVSDAEKSSFEYGMKVAKAIEYEWFNTDYAMSRYLTNMKVIHIS